MAIGAAVVLNKNTPPERRLRVSLVFHSLSLLLRTDVHVGLCNTGEFLG